MVFLCPSFSLIMCSKFLFNSDVLGYKGYTHLQILILVALLYYQH